MYNKKDESAKNSYFLFQIEYGKLVLDKRHRQGSYLTWKTLKIEIASRKSETILDFFDFNKNPGKMVQNLEKDRPLTFCFLFIGWKLLKKARNCCFTFGHLLKRSILFQMKNFKVANFDSKELESHFKNNEKYLKICWGKPREIMGKMLLNFKVLKVIK